MTSNDRHLAFGNIKERTDGTSPDFDKTPEGPQAKDHLDCFYRVIRPSGPAKDILNNANCIIGAELVVVLDGEAHIETAAGDFVVNLRHEDTARLIAAKDKGWEVHAYISWIGYDANEKSFMGEVGFMTWNPEMEVLGTYAAKQRGRINSGDHPKLQPNQQEFERILESGGSWYLTKAAPLPELATGEASFKKRRGVTDSLVAATMAHPKGATIISSIFWVVVAAVIIFFIVRHFF